MGKIRVSPTPFCPYKAQPPMGPYLEIGCLGIIKVQ
jgi:hypothetical protein